MAVSVPAHRIALRVIQEALLVLNKWAGGNVSLELPKPEPEIEQAIAVAKDLIGWSDTWQAAPLQLVFDGICLKEGQQGSHYWPIGELANQEQTDKDSPKIPYPQEIQDEGAIAEFWKKVAKTLQSLSPEEWTENFSRLFLILEKYGSYISFGDADVAFFDRVRATAAVAASLTDNPDAENLCLVAGDLSGIQPFIYTIASDGALKSLRARSFYLELVTEEMTQQLLERLELPRTNVIYTGGGKSFLLAPAGDRTQDVLRQLKDEFNQELLRQFQGKVFLNLTGQKFLKSLVGQSDFSTIWEAANDDLSQQKARKFDVQIDHLLKPHDAHEPCRVCHRDDLEADQLKPLDGADGVAACPTCRMMFRLGQKLYQVGSFVRSPLKQIPNANTLTDPIRIALGDQTIYYHLFKGSKPLFAKSDNIAKTVYLINNWDVSLYRTEYFKDPTLMLLGNYAQAVEAEENEQRYKTFISAAEMCDRAQGIKRVGHLRMDVDRLGQIFAQGLGDRYTLPRLAGLSRQMSYFFKVYLNSLAQDRSTNFLAHQSVYGLQSISQSDRENLLFIYAGGDDLFITGSWNELVEFAFDVYQSFRAYTGNHPDITLSGGISLSGPKYPLYQSADDSGNAEGEAKAQGRDRLTLFGQTFQWGEWLGVENTPVSEIKAIKAGVREYIGRDLKSNPTLALFGVFPFVAQLQPLLSSNFPKSFTRNLLSTAQVQEQFLKQAKKTNKPKAEKDEEVRAIQYFLHLPKIAYTLARLPRNIQQADEFEDIRKSLKSSYNAPYFRAIATWLDLLNRSSNRSNADRLSILSPPRPINRLIEMTETKKRPILVKKSLLLSMD